MRLEIVIEAINRTKSTLSQIQAEGTRIGKSIGESIQQGFSKIGTIQSLLQKNFSSFIPKLGLEIFREVSTGLAKVKALTERYKFPDLGKAIAGRIQGTIVSNVSQGLLQAKQLAEKFSAMMPQKQPGGGLFSGLLQGSSLLKGAGMAVKAFGQIGFAIDGVQKSLAIAQQAAGAFYNTFIGRAVELEQQLLSTKATLVATNAVMVGGERVTDPTAAIKALGAPIDAALASVREQSLELVGVTSGQLVPIFQNIAGQSASIGANLQDSANLTVDFAAALGTLSIPLEQQRQEVSSILMANISSDSTLAKSLNITNEMVKSWKSQGRLVEELNKKLEAFRAGNALAAQTISGVTSNIQEIYELITMEVGQSFIEPVVAELNEVYTWISENRDLIQDYVQRFADNIFKVGKGIWDFSQTVIQALAPIGKDVIDSIMEIMDVLGAVFEGLGSNERILKNLQVALTPLTITIDLLAKGIQTITGSWEGLMNLVSGAGAANRDALDQLSNSFDQTSQRANQYAQQLRDLEEAEKIQGELTAEQKAQRDKLVQSMGAEAAYIDQLIASYEGLDLGQQGEEMIAMLEQYRNNLSDTKLALLPLDDKGTFFYQQQLQLEQYLETLKNEAGDPAQFDAALQGITEITSAMVEAGTMTREQAVEYLRNVATNTKATGEIQQKARQELIKQLEAMDDSRQENIKSRIAEIENLRKSGDVTELAGIEEIGQLRIEGLREELAVAEEVHAEKMALIQQELDANIEKYQLQLNAMRAQLANDTSLSEGDRAELSRQITATESQITQAKITAQRQRQKATKDLANEAARVDSEIAATQVETAQQVRDQQLRNLELAQTEELNTLRAGHQEKQIALENAVLTGQKTEREANEERLAMTEEQMQMEYAQLLKKIELLNSVPLSNDPETRAAQLSQLADLEQQAGAKRLEIIQHQADAERRAREAAMEDLTNEIEKSLATLEETQINRQVELEKLVQNRVILEEDANAEIAKMTVDRTREELKAEQSKLALLQSQNPRTVEEERQHQAEIQATRIRTSQLTLSLLQQEKAAQQAAVEAVRAAIEKEMQVRRNDNTERIQALEKQTMMYDSIGKMVENVIAIEKQRASLVQSTSNYMRSQYDIAIGLADSEEEANKLKEESLKAQLALQSVEHEMQRQALEYDILRNEILLEREKIQNRIAQIQAEADLAQAEADLAKTKADPNASTEEVRAAELQVDASTAKRDSTILEQRFLDQQSALEASSADMQRTQLAQQQSTENLSLRSELAQTTGDVEAQQDIQNEALVNARDAQRDARNTARSPNSPERLRAEAEQIIQEFYDNSSQPPAIFEPKQFQGQQISSPRGFEPVLLSSNASLSKPSSKEDERLERLISAVEAQVEKLAQPTLVEASPTLNNYFQGTTDQKMVNDSQQKFLQQFDQVLKLAQQAS